MKVSIVVPIYNVEKYLCRCVDSLLSQSYQNIEVILVDDGSSDSSGKIADAYAEEHANVTVIHKENAGVSLARNTGIMAASGDYIYFADSDDWVASDAVEKMIDAVLQDHADLVMTGYYLEYPNEGYTVEFDIPDKQVFSEKQQLPDAILEMEKHNFNVLWNKLFKTAIIRENQLQFTKALSTGEDLLFICQYMMCEPSVALIPGKTYHYMRQDEDSLAGKYRKDLYTQTLMCIQAREMMYTHFDMTEQRYQQRYAVTFVQYVFTCIPNLYKPKGKLSRKERKAELRKILNTPQLGDCLKMIPEKAPYLRLTAILYRCRKTFLSFWLTEILFLVRYKLEGVYKKIRKRLNRRNRHE